METNLTNKKPYNVMLLLAGISFTLFALSKLITEIITLIPFLSPRYGMPQQVIIIQVVSAIIPVILLVVSLIFCVFMFIGKPKVMFSLFYIVMILLYIYTTITVAIGVISYISQFIDYLSYRRSTVALLGYFILYNSIFLISAIIMAVGFAIAFIISLISLIGKKPVKIWFIPGIIVTLGFIIEVIANIICLLNKPVINLIAAILDVYTKVSVNFDFASILTILLSIITSFFLVTGTFFLSKGINK